MNENLVNFKNIDGPMAEIYFYSELFDAYRWHFRIKDRPATMEKMVMFAQWYGCKEKEPSKRQIVETFLDNKVHF
jgi:hypothetical protein